MGKRWLIAEQAHSILRITAAVVNSPSSFRPVCLFTYQYLDSFAVALTGTAAEEPEATTIAVPGAVRAAVPDLIVVRTGAAALALV